MEPCIGDSVESAKDDSKSNPISVMISDSQAFDCCKCFQPLTIPVFMCDNGHIVCSTCCPSRVKECDKCSKSISLKRCKAFDNVLKSIEISCSNRKHGCMETMSYSEKKKHEEKCIYYPCKCPLFGCYFVASYELLSNHFSHKHGDSLIKFSYDNSFIVSLKSSDKVIVLQEKNNGKLFILNNNTLSMGNAINISCIGPKSSAICYCYDISARSDICNIKLESSTKNVQEVDLTTLSPEFLVIPFGCFGSSKILKLEIRINLKILLFKVESSDTIATFEDEDYGQGRDQGREHWNAVKWILRYLRGTTSARLYFGGNKATLMGYSDSGMAGDIDSRKSTLGYMIKFAGGVVAWQSRLQKCVALSSTEVEFIAVTEACKKLLWLKKFLKELGFVKDEYVLFVYNQSAIHLGNNLTFHNRSQHIDVRYHWTRDVLDANCYS
ncbi:hypothetical protein KIW84_021430 [Lathyrus oleraceus]|uniref:SIAH-type domain-containing protein n=1 Tax=Pisum sativum TaxID=3888 RepID=A0A9D4YBN2_PEA|nr:hypothetical protein KIW84_021430 [Pisum sativum]